MKHSSTRWLSMKYVAVRILEQWDNLLAYFIDFLPKQNTFKSTIKNTERFKRISSALKDEMTQCYIAFAAQDFQGFLLQFQSEQPMIHLLDHGMCKLYNSKLYRNLSIKKVYMIFSEI